MTANLIDKKILSSGSIPVEYPLGTKVRFHYKTSITGDGDQDKKVLDDSRASNSPMELIIGKKFKLEVWEAIVKTMALHEVARFRVDKSLTTQYPFVAKTLRDVRRPRAERRSHVCGATLHTDGVGYDDLNQLIANPVDLEFIIEIIKVETPDQYDKETWQMDEDEKLRAVPELKEQGNIFYRDKDYRQAADKYCTAIGILEQLMLKEKPRDEDWNRLNGQKLPILLNYAQCQLLNQEYYSVIEHCSTVISSDPHNVKAYYRRAKAHVGAWNPSEAEADLRKALELDPTLQHLVEKDLKDLDVLRKQKDSEDLTKFNGKLF